MAATKRITGKEDFNDHTDVKATGLSDKTGCGRERTRTEE